MINHGKTRGGFNEDGEDLSAINTENDHCDTALLLFSIQPAPAEVSVGTDNGREAIDINAETVKIMNLNLRYILNTWWPSEKDYVYAAATNMKSDQQLTEERETAIRDSARAFADWRNADVLPVLYLSREQAENGIRPVSHAIYCIALALHYGYYDEEIAGVSGEDAKAMCIKLINSVVAEHRSKIIPRMGRTGTGETAGRVRCGRRISGWERGCSETAWGRMTTRKRNGW